MIVFKECHEKKWLIAASQITFGWVTQHFLTDRYIVQRTIEAGGCIALIQENC
jgi:hypothetical protein